MSEFNFDEPEPKSSKFSMPDFGLWDILTLVVLLVTVCMSVYFVSIFMDPGSSMNVLKPAWTPTPTITPRQLEPTWTPTATVYVPGANGGRHEVGPGQHQFQSTLNQ